MENMADKINDNPIIKDLLWRHTAKKYDPEKRITNEELDLILESLRLSPSSINSQPWKFIVLNSNEAKQRMYNTFINKYQFNQPHIFDSSQIILFAYNPNYTRDDYAEVIDQSIKDGRAKPEDRESNLSKFMFAELNTDENGYNGNWTKAQLYIVLGNVLHTLSRLRIDATPMEGIDVKLVNKEFENELGAYQCDVALAIGYSHEKDQNKDLPKSRLSKQKVIKII